MSLGNMGEHGVRSVEATCEAYKHEASISVDNLPGDTYVPDVALRLLCSACARSRSRPDRTGLAIKPMGGAVILRPVIRDHLFEVGAGCPLASFLRTPARPFLGISSLDLAAPCARPFCA